MSAIVRHSTSVPVAADFASTDGTPFIINTATGLVYTLTDAGVVTAVGSGVGSEPSNGDKSDITVTAAGLTWTIDAGAVTLAKLDGGVTAVALGGAPASHGHAESDVTGLVADLSAKQATLVSGTNIKTINGATVLGSGDLVVTGSAPVYTAFTKDLGVARRDGTFDITGLSGLTAEKVVSIVQTAAPISSKGNARDEAEMDLIRLIGYVVNATTIRAYWQAPSVVVGNYNFAYQVSG